MQSIEREGASNSNNSRPGTCPNTCSGHDNTKNDFFNASIEATTAAWSEDIGGPKDREAWSDCGLGHSPTDACSGIPEGHCFPWLHVAFRLGRSLMMLSIIQECLQELDSSSWCSLSPGLAAVMDNEQCKSQPWTRSTIFSMDSSPQSSTCLCRGQHL